MKKILLLSIMFGGICMNAAAMEESLRRADPACIREIEMAFQNFDGTKGNEDTENTENTEDTVLLRNAYNQKYAELKVAQIELARLKEEAEAAKKGLEEEITRFNAEKEALTTQLEQEKEKAE